MKGGLMTNILVVKKVCSQQAEISHPAHPRARKIHAKLKTTKLTWPQ